MCWDYFAIRTVYQGRIGFQEFQPNTTVTGDFFDEHQRGVGGRDSICTFHHFVNKYFVHCSSLFINKTMSMRYASKINI